jgi:hypothetical protein
MKPVYGITHDISGAPRIQEPMTTKVGIGLPAGQAIYVFINSAKQWIVMVGKEAHSFATKEEAQKFYRQAKPNAPERKFPGRIPFFIFTRISPDGTYEPDWDAIAAHGPTPTEIDIVFTRDEPLDASYSMFTKTELKCKGDGKDARRINSMAAGDDEKILAKQAEDNGEKHFRIERGCWMFGCKYAKAQDDRHPSPCRPHGRLLFQLMASPTLGGTSHFVTTGFRSINQLFSCLETFKAVTGRGISKNGFVSGIPLKLVLRPYKVSHNGQSATQYGVSLQFRASSAIELKKLLTDHAVQYRLAEAEPLKQLNAAPLDMTPKEIPHDDDIEPIPEVVAAMAREFYPEMQNPDDEDFIDPESSANEPSIAMPKRASDVRHDGNGVNSDGRQLIDSLWDENAPKQPQPADPAQSPPGLSDLEPISAAAIPQSQPKSGKNRSDDRWKKLLESARLNGITNQQVFNEMGRLGAERASELTSQMFAELENWVRQQYSKAVE